MPLEGQTIKKVDLSKLIGQVISTTSHQTDAPCSNFLVVNASFIEEEKDDTERSWEDFFNMKDRLGVSHEDVKQYYIKWNHDKSIAQLQLIDTVTSKPYECFASPDGFSFVSGWICDNTLSIDPNHRGLLWVNCLYFLSNSPTLC